MNKNTQQLLACSKHSLSLLDQIHYRLIFTGYQTTRVRSESDENVTSLKPKWHDEMHNGDVMVCLFAWQLIAHCNHNYDGSKVDHDRKTFPPPFPCTDFKSGLRPFLLECY